MRVAQRSRLLSALSVALVILAVSAGTVSANYEYNWCSVEPQSQNVAVGSSFTVNVWIRKLLAGLMNHFYFHISWDPSTIAAPGSGFKAFRCPRAGRAAANRGRTWGRRERQGAHGAYRSGTLDHLIRLSSGNNSVSLRLFSSGAPSPHVIHSLDVQWNASPSYSCTSIEPW